MSAEKKIKRKRYYPERHPVTAYFFSRPESSRRYIFLCSPRVRYLLEDPRAAL